MNNREFNNNCYNLIRRLVTIILCASSVSFSVACNKASETETQSTVSLDSPYFVAEKFSLGHANQTMIFSTVYNSQFIAVTTDINQDANGSGYLVMFFDEQGKETKLINLNSIISPLYGISSFICDINGHLYFLIPNNNPGNANEYSLYEIDPEGVCVGEAITFSFKTNAFPISMTINSFGDIYILDSEGLIAKYNKTGQKEQETTANGDYQKLFILNDIVYVDSIKVKGKDVFCPVFEKPELAVDCIDMDYLAQTNFTTRNSSIDYCNSTGVYETNPITNETQMIFSWNDSNYSSIQLNNPSIYFLSENTIYLVNISQQGSDAASIEILRREIANPNAEKIEITLGGFAFSTNNDVQTAVEIFNANNLKYHIEMKDYYSGVEQADNFNNAFLAAQKQMKLDILSGNGPDIMYGNYSELAVYANAGVFIDLNTCMDSDDKFRKADYFENIFDCLQEDNQLFEICPSFGIQGIVGAQSLIGDKTSYTFAEFEQLSSLLESDENVLSCIPMTSLLINGCAASMNTLVDEKSRKAKFNSVDFIQILEFAKKYGVLDSEYLQNGDPNWIDPEELIKTGKTATEFGIVGGVNSYALLESTFNSNISMIGIPNLEGRGPVCNPSNCLAILRSDNSQGGAWKFVKTFLGEEMQRKEVENGNIPVLISAFEESISNAKSKGNESKIQISEESALRYSKLVSSIDSVYILDSDICDVIYEESLAFFVGDKTSQNVANIIQNRVQTIIDEK